MFTIEGNVIYPLAMELMRLYYAFIPAVWYCILSVGGKGRSQCKGQGKGKSGFLGKRKRNAADGGPPNKTKHEDKTEEPATSD